MKVLRSRRIFYDYSFLCRVYPETVVSHVAMGCSNVQAMAYLPWGSLERWKKPNIVIILVHQRGDATSLLSLTLEALSMAHYVGDCVELKLVFHAGAVNNREVYCISIVSVILVLGRALLHNPPSLVHGYWL